MIKSADLGYYNSCDSITRTVSVTYFREDGSYIQICLSQEDIAELGRLSRLGIEDVKAQREQLNTELVTSQKL